MVRENTAGFGSYDQQPTQDIRKALELSTQNTVAAVQGKMGGLTVNPGIETLKICEFNRLWLLVAWRNPLGTL